MPTSPIGAIHASVGEVFFVGDSCCVLSLSVCSLSFFRDDEELGSIFLMS